MMMIIIETTNLIIKIYLYVKQAYFFHTGENNIAQTLKVFCNINNYAKYPHKKDIFPLRIRLYFSFLVLTSRIRNGTSAHFFVPSDHRAPFRSARLRRIKIIPGSVWLGVILGTVGVSTLSIAL